MKRKLLAVAGLSGFLTLASSGFAALPPYWQSQAELKRILEDDAIAELFTSGRAIESIKRAGDGYDISSARCSLHVKIEFKPARDGRVGPAEFSLKVPKTLTCQD